MSCDAGWSSAACTKCVGQGSIPAADGFDPCPQCGGAGKLRTRSACCARHGDDAEIGPLGGTRPPPRRTATATATATAPGRSSARSRPPGSTLPGFTGTIPASLEELFATLELVDTTAIAVAKEAFENKVVGVYFSASHCPACVRFSPTLDAFTERNAADYVTVLSSGRQGRAIARRGTTRSARAPRLSVPFAQRRPQPLMSRHTACTHPRAARVARARRECTASPPGGTRR